MMAAGLIDAAVVGGVDSLCLTTLYGFNSLGLISDQACRPFDAESQRHLDWRSGGVRAARAPTGIARCDAVLLLGVGESSDAYHMSSPPSDGRGARMAMQDALKMAGLPPADIDYINLHGTATPSNDAAKATPLHRVRLGWTCNTPCQFHQGATGHTLGASGGLEAVICAIALQKTCCRAALAPARRTRRSTSITCARRAKGRCVMRCQNSFGFGGTNAA